MIWIDLIQEAFLCVDEGSVIRLCKSPALFCIETLQVKRAGSLALIYILLLILVLDFVLWLSEVWWKFFIFSSYLLMGYFAMSEFVQSITLWYMFK